VLDYQLALMKLSGIDGVIIDWYGIEDCGEGTIIEPTIERGYEALEKLQRFRKGLESDFAFTELDLRAPIVLIFASKFHWDIVTEEQQANIRRL
jgi:hypothetical protein